jgi:hypothetical protein
MVTFDSRRPKGEKITAWLTTQYYKMVFNMWAVIVVFFGTAWELCKGPN